MKERESLPILQSRKRIKRERKDERKRKFTNPPKQEKDKKRKKG